MNSQQQRTVFSVLVLGAFVLAGAGVYGLRDSSAPESAALSTPAERGGLSWFSAADDESPDARAAGAQVPFVTGLENLPNSLQGTEVDGTLEVDADGHLKITPDVRRVFEYFLTLQGEEPLPRVLARLQAYFADRLPPAAAAEAARLLAAYLDYKYALAAIDAPTAAVESGIDIAAVQARMDQAKALRGQFLSREAADAFYAEDDAYDQYSLGRYAVLQRADLAPAEQARQLAALEDALPPGLKATVRATTQYVELRRLSDDWQARGGSAAELRDIRENLLGAEAADRLEALDAERAAWEARLSSWLAERDSLMANAALDVADRAAQVERLRAQRFTAAERMRVEALEQARDGTG